MAVHVLQAEEALRLQDSTQQLYQQSRESPAFEALRATGWLLEDELQMAVMRWHGVLQPTSLTLQLYRQALARHYYSPAVQNSAFFIRLNIMKEVPPVGTEVPLDISLLELSSRSPLSLRNLLDKANSLNKMLILFCGSIT